MNKDAIDRREFIKAAAAVAAGIALANVSGVQAQPASTPQTQHKSLVGFTTPPMQKIRLGFVGTGGRGTSLIREFLKCEGTEVNAVCDVRAERAAKAKEIVEA